MPSKICFKCHKRKRLDLFYTNKRMADGHINKCKSCAKSDMREWYRRPENRKKMLIYDKERNKTPERKLAVAHYNKKRRLLRPGANRCWNWTSRAIRDGRLIRMKCEVCEAEKTEAHHDDYRRPSKIRWLCFKHHREIEHGQTCST